MRGMLGCVRLGKFGFIKHTNKKELSDTEGRGEGAERGDRGRETLFLRFWHGDPPSQSHRVT